VIRRPSRRAWGILVASVLAVVPAAVAADPPLPWAGGLAVETPFERYAGDQATVVAGRPVKVYCNGANDWGRLGAQERFDPVTVWGFVVFSWDRDAQSYRPGDYMQLSEAACRYLDEYWRAPLTEKGKRCRTATQITFVHHKVRVRVVRRVQARGRWHSRVTYVTKTVQSPVSVPQFGTCPDYQNRIFALQTISHESQHLSGVQDEANAECNGMQRLGWFAQRFGATVEQARQMAGDYFHDFYLAGRPGTPYFLASCPDPSTG
jgi:hypothetical protein